MSMLNICGMQLKYLTAYNEYIADIIIAVIVYLSAFSMLVKQLLNGRKKKGGAK
jgi:simple sugar transport system permease protein